MPSDKEVFYDYIFSRRTHLVREWAKKLAELREKKDKLEEKLDGMDDKKNRDIIKGEIGLIDNEIKKVKEELDGSMLKKCLEQVEKMKDVKEIRYYPQRMEIITNNIKLQNKNIGSYIIDIRLGDCVKISRVDGFTYNGKCHPFVVDCGPCFGVWNPAVNMALRNGGIYTIATASLKLLRCSTRDNSGWYISPANFCKVLSKGNRGEDEDEDEDE